MGKRRHIGKVRNEVGFLDEVSLSFMTTLFCMGGLVLFLAALSSTRVASGVASRSLLMSWISIASVQDVGDQTDLNGERIHMCEIVSAVFGMCQRLLQRSGSNK